MTGHAAYLLSYKICKILLLKYWLILTYEVFLTFIPSETPKYMDKQKLARSSIFFFLFPLLLPPSTPHWCVFCVILFSQNSAFDMAAAQMMAFSARTMYK